MKIRIEEDILSEMCIRDSPCRSVGGRAGDTL